MRARQVIGAEHSASRGASKPVQPSADAGDARLLHRATALFIALAGEPLRNYASGTGVALFEEDFITLFGWSQDSARRAALDDLYRLAGACRNGTYGHLALRVEQVTTGLMRGEEAVRAETFNAAIADLAVHLRKAHHALGRAS